SVYAQDSTSLLLDLPQVLAQGEYQIRVDLTDPETKTSAKAKTAIASTAAATPPPPPPVQFLASSGTPRPNGDDVQFLDISATVDNSGEPLTSIQVVLRATRNGESVEDFRLASSLALPTGQTQIQERYSPVTGWEDGTWRFTLSVEAVDPGSGVAQVLATADLADVEIS
ncbi:MAG: hypothetical protein QOF73_5203, partial [Thermomicrobiales bacterium]|nr:hypothetical protein [Thermomicrobiales bacterium]